jgi:hypothetical protein
VSGDLRYDGHVVRQINRKAKNIRLLLDSFEEQHWQTRIESPFPQAAKSRRLRDTVDSLKENLRLITFRCDGSGEGVEWLEVAQHRRKTGA